MNSGKTTEQIADDFIDELYEKFGTSGFEFDSYYINDVSDKDGIIVQLWLEWFCGSVVITRDAKAEYDTLIFPRGQLNEDQLPIIKRQLELFRREHPYLTFSIRKDEQQNILVHLDQYIVDLNSNNEDGKAINMHLEKVCDIAKNCYFKIKESISD